MAGVTAEGCQSTDILEINGGQPPYPMAAVQQMPAQEPGAPRRIPGR
jgi:hypothetical protein